MKIFEAWLQVAEKAVIVKAALEQHNDIGTRKSFEELIDILDLVRRADPLATHLMIQADTSRKLLSTNRKGVRQAVIDTVEGIREEAETKARESRP